MFGEQPLLLLTVIIDLEGYWPGVSSKPCLPPTGITTSHLAPWILWESAQVPQQNTYQRNTDPCPQAHLSTVLRSDAAWRAESTAAGLGWTISKHEETLEFAGRELQVFSPLMGEALALRVGLRKCRELGICELNCQSDSKMLINSINNGNALPEVYGVVADILCIATEFVSISFAWISREKNRAADVLAKQSLNVFGGGSPPT